MATFQIHEDAENRFQKIQCRKLIGSMKNDKNDAMCNGKENNRQVLQPITKNCGYNNEQKRGTLKNCMVEQKEKKPDQKKKVELETSCLDSAVVKVGKQECRTIACDEKDGFPVSLAEANEYREDIWRYYMQLEREYDRPRPTYMHRQLSLTWGMRSVLVDWLASVSEEYRLHDGTLHLAVGYVDRFLAQISVVRDKFQLVGAAAMMIAGKLEEIYPPDTAEWAYLTGDAYSVRQLLKMEQLMLRVLKFRLQPPTTLTFVQHLCTEHRMDQQTTYLAMYLTELVLLEGQGYLEHMPSLLAAASIALARFTLKKKKLWPEQLRATSGYTLKQLSPVVQRQQKTFRDSPLKENQAIQNKYKTDKYHRVALLKPKVLNMEDLAE